MSSSAKSDPEGFIKTKRFARASAVQFLYQVDMQGDLEVTPKQLERFWEQVSQQEEADDIPSISKARAFAFKLINGVIEKLEALDKTIAVTASNWKVDRMSVIDRNILRLAAFELEFTDSPPKAIVNEGIELAKLFGDTESSRFVNGVLDKLYRNSSKGAGKS